MLRNLFSVRVLRCITERPICQRMPMSLRSPPEKKLKPNLATINRSGEHNLADGMRDKMPADSNPGSQGKDAEKTAKVEYLDTPVKSENDKKEYRVIKLENGLTALLIADTHSNCQDDEADAKVVMQNEDEEEDDEESEEGSDEESDEDDEDEDDDEDHLADHGDRDSPNGVHAKKFKREEKMAACGLCVGVGSFSDPLEIPGLAHFLEHMVFMGSEKYPQENDFDAFIRKRGGSDNASTECEQTTFYFEIQEKDLQAALDRFAQFFIKPLMKRDAINRESEAVESEFQMALPSDLYRKERLFCTFAKPNHPATKFSWGNLITLRTNVTPDNLYEQLHKFRERHYSAHRMTLAIQARLPLDVLEDYVTQCFANVPSNNLPPDDFTIFKGADSFDTTNFRKIYKIKPIKDVCQIELTWAMPPLHDLYKSKPHQYISWIIGHEGKGSLISYFRKKMWCLDIFSGNGESGFEHSSMYALFSLYLVLTDEGHEHLPEVLSAIFSYINLIRKEGPQKRIYDEIHQIEETNFRFIDEVPPVENVEDLCENMHFYPPKDYITGSDLYFEYNPTAIKMCMDYLSPDNVNIIISDKKFNDEEFDHIETWFKTKYAYEDIPQEWIENWRTIEPLPDFHLPLPNIYLTDDFSLIPLPENVPKYPSKIYKDDLCEIWYRPDPKFRLPECYINFYLISPITVSSAKNAALRDLLVVILKQLLIEDLYPATTAELNHYIYPSDKGIIIKVDGINQKLPLLLTAIAECIADCPKLVTKELFDVMKKQQIKYYYNTFLKPEKLAKGVRLSILMDHFWSAVDKYEAVGDLEFSDFQHFVSHLTQHSYVQSLVQGNMTGDDVIKHVRNCVEILKCGPLLPDTMPAIRVLKVPMGTHYCKVRNFNKMDVNSVVTNYYQSGVGFNPTTVIIELLMMMMEEPLFNQLRTQEQLGYDVFCLLRDTFGVFGYSITVCTQADKYCTEHVDERMEAFIQSFIKTLNETSEEEMENVKEALIKLKQCADVHLKEEVNRNWAEITTCQYIFDRIEKEVNWIQNIRMEDLTGWMKSHTVGGSEFNKLSVHVVGTVEKQNNKDDNEEANKNENLEMECKCDLNMENGKIAKYPLMYISPSETEVAKSSATYITDINSYKQSQAMWPLQAVTEDIPSS